MPVFRDKMDALKFAQNIKDGEAIVSAEIKCEDGGGTYPVAVMRTEYALNDLYTDIAMFVRKMGYSHSEIIRLPENANTASRIMDLLLRESVVETIIGYPKKEEKQ